MVNSDLFLTTTIIAIAGGISVLAIIFSKLCLFLKRNNEKEKISKYESGFESQVSEKFHYLTDKGYAIALYLVLELAFIWLLVCVAYHISNSDWYGMHVIKLLSVAIIISIIIAGKTLNDRI